MAMTLHQLKIFWAVAQAKSYTKASKILGLAQPSLSQQISKLEEELFQFFRSCLHIWLMKILATSKLINSPFPHLENLEWQQYHFKERE